MTLVWRRGKNKSLRIQQKLTLYIFLIAPSWLTVHSWWISLGWCCIISRRLPLFLLSFVLPLRESAPCRLQSPAKTFSRRLRDVLLTICRGRRSLREGKRRWQKQVSCLKVWPWQGSYWSWSSCPGFRMVFFVSLVSLHLRIPSSDTFWPTFRFPQVEICVWGFPL